MITKTEAISFLQEHQPMPKDNELSDEIINKYDEVREFFVNNPNNQCIPLCKPPYIPCCRYKK